MPDESLEDLKAHLEAQIRWKVGLETRVTQVEQAVANIRRLHEQDKVERAEDREETRRWFNRFYFALLGGMVTVAVMLAAKLFGG